MVKHIKETIKRSMKAGSSLAAAPAARSSSFRRNNTEDRLNSSDPGPFLRVNSEPSTVFRRSFSHNPESTKNRRSSLESDASHSSEGNADTESISSGTVSERKISLKKKNKAVSPLGMENGLINLWSSERTVHHTLFIIQSFIFPNFKETLYKSVVKKNS